MCVCVHVLSLSHTHTHTHTHTGGCMHIHTVREVFVQLPNFTTLPKICLLGKVFVSFKGRVIFSQYVPKKCKHFGIKISYFVTRLDTCMTWKYTWGRIAHGIVCYNNSYDCDRTDEADRRTWVQIVHGNGKETCCCGTVRQNRRGMPLGLAPKTVKLKWGDFRIRTRTDLTAVLWWDKGDICMLTNIHDVPVECSFSSEGGKVIKVANCD